MMAAEILTAAVAVLSDASPQPLDLVLFAGHTVQVFVHKSLELSEALRILRQPSSFASMPCACPTGRPAPSLRMPRPLADVIWSTG
jgi:hypothetical protein